VFVPRSIQTADCAAVFEYMDREGDPDGNLRHMKSFHSTRPLALSSHTARLEACFLLCLAFRRIRSQGVGFARHSKGRSSRSEHEVARADGRLNIKPDSIGFEGYFVDMIFQRKNESGLGGDPFLHSLAVYSKIIKQRQVLSPLPHFWSFH